jgi:tRNA-binding protein
MFAVVSRSSKPEPRAPDKFPPRPVLRYAHRIPVQDGPLISYAEFDKVDIRVGRIVKAENFPAARKPAYKLVIDFGPDLGTRTSSAQLTRHYTVGELEGRLVLAVVNFPPRQIGPFQSQVLTLGVPDANGGVVLIVPDKKVPIGGRLF